VAWNEEQLQKLPDVVEENRGARDTEARLLSKEELYELEPGLGAGALGAVLCPRECVVEPWLVPMGYAESARLHGAQLHTGTRVVAATRGQADGNNQTSVWTVAVKRSLADHALQAPGRSRNGSLLVPTPPHEAKPSEVDDVIQAKVVINCAGLYGDQIELIRMGGKANDTGLVEGGLDAPFRVTPRKGQFIVFKPRDDSAHGPAPTHIIEPVATQFTKGVIAWTSPYGNIIVGPTAEPQTDREDRSTHAQTIADLRAFGEKALPVIRDAEVVGTYSGLRPATEFRDYQIQARPESMWITVGGIRSTGLTASSGIAEYVGNIYENLAAGAPESLLDFGSNKEATLQGVTAAASNPFPLGKRSLKSNPPVPSLEDLAEDYGRRGDGCVELYGQPQRVTHPQSSFGMEAYVSALAPS